MTDFKKAIRAGIAAHEDNERAKAEILAVVDEMARQLREATEGQITAKLNRRRRSAGGSLIAALAMQFEYYEALVGAVAITKAGALPELEAEFCEFARSDYGYPVTLKYASVEELAHDRASLEAGLGRMLEHPNVGAAIARLMAMSAHTGTAPTLPAATAGGLPGSGGETPSE